MNSIALAIDPFWTQEGINSKGNRFDMYYLINTC